MAAKKKRGDAIKLSRNTSPAMIVAPRMDAGNIPGAIDALNRAFNEFRQKNDERLNSISKRFDDVVLNEHVDRINASISELSATVQEHNNRLASFDGGANVDPADAVRRDHANLFNAWFRRGRGEHELRDFEARNELRSDSDPDGGYLVPEEMQATIDRVTSTSSAMRRLARVQPVGSAVYKKLVNTGTAASGWVGETAARTETGTPTLKELSYPTMEIYANPAVTQGLLDDSAFNVETWLADEINIEFAAQEGSAFITGDGVNKPRGFISGYTPVANASFSKTAMTGLGFILSGAAGSIGTTMDALVDLVYAVKPRYRAGAVWMMNDLTTAAVRKLKDTANQYLWQPPTQLGQPASLLGYAVESDDNMPDIGAANYPIAFGNFNAGYLIVDRAGIRVLRDPYTNKPYVHFYTTKRVGGGIQDFEAIKLLKSNNS